MVKSSPKILHRYPKWPYLMPFRHLVHPAHHFGGPQGNKLLALIFGIMFTTCVLFVNWTLLLGAGYISSRKISCGKTPGGQNGVFVGKKPL